MNSIQPAGELSVILYQLRSVTPAVAPPDGEGTWFRYVIAQGDNEITGLRTGSADEVEMAVRAMVERLNERSKGKNVKTTRPAQVAAINVSADPGHGQA